MPPCLATVLRDKEDAPLFTLLNNTPRVTFHKIMESILRFGRFRSDKSNHDQEGRIDWNNAIVSDPV